VRVLIVEDEIRIRVSVVRVLSKRGFTMDQASTLKEAEQHLAARTYDAVLLDWQLPDGDGIDLCARIRGRTPRTHVLMLTGRAEHADRLRAFDAGVDDYVVKQDIDLEEIGSRLRAVQRRQPSAPPPAKSA